MQSSSLGSRTGSHEPERFEAGNFDGQIALTGNFGQLTCECSVHPYSASDCYCREAIG